MHRDRFPEDERPGFSSFAAGRSSHGFSSAGAAVPNASRQRMLAGRSLPRGMFRSLSDRIGYGAQEGTVRAASDECAALPSNTAGLSPMRGPLLSRFFGCPGAAARISPRARTFPPRCRTAGPCAFLTEGRSGRSLRNAPRGRDLRRRINRGPHGSEEPRSAAGAAFRNRPDSLSGRQTIPTGPLRNDSERLSKRSCETPQQNPGCTESPRHKPATIPKEPGNVHEIRLQCLRRQERFLPRNGGGASSRQTAKPPRSVSFQLHFVENYRPMRIILQ